MSYPHDQLTDGETVLRYAHSHWKTLILPLMGASTVAAGCGFLATLGVAPIIGGVLGIIALIAVAWLGLAPWLRWRTTHFVVTDARVMFREGVLRRIGMNIPLSRITSVSTEIDLNDRVFGCGTLVIESASNEPLRFTDIPAVESVHTLLYQALDGDATALLPQ